MKKNNIYKIILLIVILLFTVNTMVFCQIISNATGNWSDAGTWVGGIVPNSDDNVEIVSGHTITLTADAECVNLTLTSGKIVIGSYTFTIYGNLSGAQSDSIFTTSSSKLVINDAGSKTQFTFPSKIIYLQKLTLNRATGATCSHNIYLDSLVPADSAVLVLTNGILYMTSGSKIMLKSKAIKQTISCSNSSFVDGIVCRNIPKNSGIFTFPVGDNNRCRQFGVGLANGNDSNIHEVRFIYATPVNSTFINFGFLPGGINQHFYWEHIQTDGANPQRRIYYEDTDFPGLNSADRVANLTLANNDGSFEANWTKPSTGWTVYDDVGMKYVQFDGANNANSIYWTFGSTSDTAAIQVLPIELVSFTAKYINNAVELEWITASELNNDYFIVEKSYDGETFESFYTVNGAGNSSTMITYKAIDYNVIPLITYYRLKQFDYDGKFSYSNMEVINPEIISEDQITIFPNPASTIAHFKINSYKTEDLFVSLKDITSKTILEQRYSLGNGPNTISIDVSSLKKDVYIVSAYSKSRSISFVKKMIVY